MFSPGHHQLCSVQVRPSCSEGMADDVRSGQDVSALSEPLETGNANREEATRTDGRSARLQNELHQVSSFQRQISNQRTCQGQIS